MSLPEGRRRPRRLGYANITATLALVLALGGGTAWAAHHYLITSTAQIKPSVVQSLRGQNGANGTNGTAGATGATGATGANLTAETVLPSGQSESGVYAGSAQGDTMSAAGIVIALQYTQPLASPIASSHIVETTSTTTDCPGQGHAASGYLCLYSLQNAGMTFDGVPNDYTDLPSPDPGALVYYYTTAYDSYVSGTWTVTAP